MLSNRFAFRHAVRAWAPPRVALQPIALTPRTRCLRAASDKAGPKKSDRSTPTRPYITEIAANAPFPNNTHFTVLPFENPIERELATAFSTIINRITSPWGSLKVRSPWGYAVIRAVYGPGSDEPWQRLLKRLEDDVQSSFEAYPKAGILPERHVLTPIEDAARLDGVSSHEVRDVFMEWVAAEKKIWAKLPDVEDEVCGTRYNFCLFFDTACLDRLGPDGSMLYPKILSKNSLFREPHERNYTIHPGWEDGETEHDEEDVGWMYMDFQDYVSSYASLDDPSWWYDMQERAPRETHYPSW